MLPTVFALIAAAQKKSKAAAKTVSISGRVKVAVTGEAIEGAVVTLSIPGEFVPADRKYTDKDARFIFSKVAGQSIGWMCRCRVSRLFGKRSMQWMKGMSTLEICLGSLVGLEIPVDIA